MTFAFMTEKGAERFVSFLAEEFDLDVDILSFLHVEVDDDEFSGENELRDLDRIQAMAERCGAEDVLL